jgi:hypothetical protein
VIQKNDKKSDNGPLFSLDFLSGFFEIYKIVAAGIEPLPKALILIFFTGAVLILGASAIIAYIFKNNNAFLLFQNLIWVISVLFLLIIILIYFSFKKEISEQKNKVKGGSAVNSPTQIPDETILLAATLNDSDRTDIKILLREATLEVSSFLSISPNLVRSNIFGLDGDSWMRIIRDLTYNMSREDELKISMKVGYGSTGRCFENETINIAIFREGWQAGWGRDGSGVVEGDRADPDLRWIISIPIFLKDHQGMPKKVWVLNVDGLNHRPSREKLGEVSTRLPKWATTIALILTERLNSQWKSQR